MCFSLPTPEDPFNDRHANKKKQNNNNSSEDKHKPKPNNKDPLQVKDADIREDRQQQQPPGINRPKQGGDFEDGCLPKFLILCLNAIRNSWKEEEGNAVNLLASPWGAELWRSCSSGSDIMDSSGGCASKEQLAWLLSTASDIIASKEKQGQLVATPFLLFLVPSQQKAAQVRSICKPLKALGIHTVSLHPGVSIDHQIHGLKSCEPEFLVSTPDRLLELVRLGAIDISAVSLLVLDDLKSMADFGFSVEIESIKKIISGGPQIVIFGDCHGEAPASSLRGLLKEPVCRLSLVDSAACQVVHSSHNPHM